MWVRALKSFGGVTATGSFHVSQGSVFELPEGADWLRAGLVEKADGPAGAESAMMPTARTKPVGKGEMAVSEVPGIGYNYASALADIGIGTIAALAAADEEYLTTIEGVGLATAQKWQKAARELLING